MTASDFRLKLRQRLAEAGGKVLLRIALSPNIDQPQEFTGSQILKQAQELVRDHVQQPAGSVVLILLPHSAELFLLHLGLILEGYIPAILAWPTSRIDAEKYQRNLLYQLRNLPADQLITSPRLAENLGPALPYITTPCLFPGHSGHDEAFAKRLHLDDLEPVQGTARSDEKEENAIFLQFSGGTTGAQKCVVITAEIMTAQLQRLKEYLTFGEGDGVASWLPMYHDMGLIACLWFPLWNSRPSLQMGASDWLLNPDLLFRFMQRYQATFCWLPNFSFSYLAAQKSRMNGPYDLSHVRAWVNCSEPVRLSSIESFAKEFSDWGVQKEQCQASYAMAENVFAVTQTPLSQTISTVPRTLVREQAIQTEFDVIDDVYVSSGFPLKGMSVRIIDANQEILPEGKPGEIQLQTESLFQGYWGNEGFSRSAISTEGWYSTGDYGFFHEGQLYVIGRLKDIIIVGGQNVFPEDVETIVNSLNEVYTGRTVAFGITNESLGTESLCIVAEMRGEYETSRANILERQIKQSILAGIGIAPRFASVVPERWIVKSTAGKISRRETRQKFLKEKLAPKK